MPDWITHLGIAYLLGRLIKIRDIRLLLLGSVLPDIARLTYLSRISDLSEISLIALLEPLHSPLIIVLMSLAIALLNQKPKAAFLILAFGSSIHLLLDMVVSAFGYPRLLLYPLSYKAFAINLFPHESIFSILLIGISSIALFHAIFTKKRKDTKFSLKNLKYVTAISIVIVAMPVITFDRFIDKVDYISQYNEDRNELYFAYAEITSANQLRIDGLGREYIVEKTPLIESLELNKGDRVSIKAKATGNKIRPYLVHKHSKYLIAPLSTLGLLSLMTIWFNPLKRWKRYWRN